MAETDIVTPAPATDVAATTIADPAPLGLAGFAATTFALSAVNAGILPKSVEPLVVPIALFYGGLAQFLAGMWEFRKGNTFGATAFGTFGAFWMALALFMWEFAGKIPPAQAATATGMFLLVFTIFTVIILVAALKTNTALIVTLTLLLITFIALDIAELGGSAGAGVIGGWLGLVTAVVAWYTAMAGVCAATFGRPVLPVGARA